MSMTRGDQDAPSRRPKFTPATLQQRKVSGTPITAITAYDYPTAKLVDGAGIDVILVGDSLGMAVLGYSDTLSVTMEDMLHHARAVRRGADSSMLIADMPYGSYHVSTDESLRNAIRFIKEAGVEAVKIEGGYERVNLVRAFTDAEIPVVGHIGLTPQSLHKMGGYKVQGRSIEALDALCDSALELEQAGAIAVVLEGMPLEVAARITSSLTIPTIGIGAGVHCDGQILVFHDIFNLTFASPAKFVRRFGDAAQLFQHGLEQYRDEVLGRTFPQDGESYHLPQGVREELDNRVDAVSA